MYYVHSYFEVSLSLASTVFIKTVRVWADSSTVYFNKYTDTCRDNIHGHLCTCREGPRESVDIKQNFTEERAPFRIITTRIAPVIFAILAYAWNFPTRAFRLVEYLQRLPLAAARILPVRKPFYFFVL